LVVQRGGVRRRVGAQRKGGREGAGGAGAGDRGGLSMGAPDRDRAEDLVQDALAAVVRRPPDPLTDEVVRAWLRTTMTRMYLRRRHRALLEARALIRHGSPADTAHPWSAETEDLLRSLTLLSPRQRACVTLRYLEDLSEQQVAEQLGLRTGTVKAHLAQAREKLRGGLTPGAASRHHAGELFDPGGS